MVCSPFAYAQDTKTDLPIVPLEAEAHFRQGMIYAKQESYKNALLEFKKALELYPCHICNVCDADGEVTSCYADAYANIGVVYIAQNKLNLAVENLKKAVLIDKKLERKNGLAYYNLAVVHSLREELDLGIEALDKALEQGFNEIDALRGDPDLKNLRKHPEFTKTLEKYHIFL
jgi:tetratricopeptide (TPR) repeat protein